MGLNPVLTALLHAWVGQEASFPRVPSSQEAVRTPGHSRPDVLTSKELPGSCCRCPGPQRQPRGSPHPARPEDCSPDGLWGRELGSQSTGSPVANEFVASHAPFVEDECLRQGVGCGNPPGAGLPPELFPCSVCVLGGGVLLWKEGRTSPRHCLSTLRPHDMASSRHMGRHTTEMLGSHLSYREKQEVGLAGSSWAPGGTAHDCLGHLWKEQETLGPTRVLPSPSLKIRG